METKNALLTKTTFLKVLVLSGIMFTASFTCYSQSGVGINATGAAANPSAMLDVASTTRGLLLPRMTTAQRNAIVSPAIGLTVYNTDINTFDYYNGIVWVSINPNATTGGGTLNYLTKWTNAGGTIIGNSLVYDNGTALGIGTTAPASLFHSAGQIRTGIPLGGLGGASAATGSLLYYNASNTNTVNIQSGVTSVSYSLTLPGAQGATNTVLQNDGSGNLSWTSSSSWIGSGTQNYLTKWSNAGGTAIGNSQITDNGSQVVVGTASSPQANAKFDVVGSNTATDGTNGVFLDVQNSSNVTNNLTGIRFTGSSLGSYLKTAILIPYTNGSWGVSDMIFALNNSNNSTLVSTADAKMIIKSSGYVGIGTTSPNYKLHVIEPAAGARAIYAENTYIGTSDGYGLYARSVNNPDYGYGAYGEGGYMGLYGNGNGTTNAASTFGVYGYASGSAGTRYGVYGGASGGATNYGLFCSGNGAYTGTWSQVSDKKFKKNFNPINGATQLITQLNPITYELKTDEYEEMNLPKELQYGFTAQEMEQVVPALVGSGRHPGKSRHDPEQEFKTVNYIGLIPILTQAIKEQQQQIEELKKEIQDLKNK